MAGDRLSLPVLHIGVDEYWSFISCPLCQVVSERQREFSRAQKEVNQLRQELQKRTSQEEGMRQQVSEKEEKTRKAFVMAKQKINQLMGEKVSPHRKHDSIYKHVNLCIFTISIFV